MKPRDPASGEKQDAAQPWALDAEETLRSLSVSREQGLDGSEAASRLDRYGPNSLHASRERSVWAILLDQFKNLIILLLGTAAVLSFAFGRWLEGVSILIAVVLNAGIGFFTEWRAVRSMEALEKLGHTRVRTLRDGRTREIDSENLVPGDLVFVEAGDMVPADLRLLDASGLKADESSMTGESEGVPKQVEPIEAEAALSERFNMLFRGTAVTGGSGTGVVTATGMETELGRIAAMAEGAEEDEETPLEKRLDRLGRRLVWVTLAVTVVVALSGILVGKDLLLIIETAIALAVAAIPEGLPIVATIALARGMWRMAGRNALINRLSAVETLGSTTVICTDKTGTLTENRLSLRRVALPGGSEPVRELDLGEGETPPASEEGGELLRALLETGALCIEASEHAGSRKGDPLETALVSAAGEAGVARDDLLESMPLEREVPFDRSVRMMAVYNALGEGRYRVSVKGAPEAVLEVCSRIRTPEGTVEMDEASRRRWEEQNRDLAGEDGLRVLAGAVKEVEDQETAPYEGLTFQGLYGLMDPPREGVRESVAACHRAGMRVVMVTGDQPMTARSIALALGLADEEGLEVVRGEEIGKGGETANRERMLRTPVFARVSPRQKLDLVTIHQEAGEVVAMTGDGVNDAPALKKADIGIAMGMRGTQVARQAADMVLKDDAFYSIVAAVEQGRAIFHNIRKFILYLLSGNVSEIMIVTAALLAGAPLPLLPLQILYLNLIGDVFPALALGMGTGDPSLMERPPRDPKEAVLTRRHWVYIVASSVVLAAAVLGGFALSFHWLEADRSGAVTVSFLTLAFARLWHVFNMREKGTHVLKNDVVRNPFVWGALGLCSTLLLAGAYLPGLSLVLGLEAPDAGSWFLILGMSLVPLAILQLQKGRASR